MFEKIFFPFDLSKTSENLLYAIKELRKFGAKKLKVFYAIEYDPEALTEAGVDIESFLTKLKTSASTKLKNVTEKLSKYFETEYEISTTINAVDEILKVSASFDMIVIPSKSRTSFEFGSVAERIIKKSNVPTLIVKASPNFDREYYEFLLSRLLDKVALINLKEIPMLPKFNNVLLVHVADVDSILEQKLSKEEIIHPLTPITKLTEYLSEYWDKAKEDLEKVKRSLEENGIKAEFLISLSEKKLKDHLRDGTTMIIVRKDHFSLVSDFPVILVIP